MECWSAILPQFTRLAFNRSGCQRSDRPVQRAISVRPTSELIPTLLSPARCENLTRNGFQRFPAAITWLWFDGMNEEIIVDQASLSLISAARTPPRSSDHRL